MPDMKGRLPESITKKIDGILIGAPRGMSVKEVCHHVFGTMRGHPEVQQYIFHHTEGHLDQGDEGKFFIHNNTSGNPMDDVKYVYNGCGLKDGIAFLDEVAADVAKEFYQHPEKYTSGISGEKTNLIKKILFSTIKEHYPQYEKEYLFNLEKCAIAHSGTGVTKEVLAASLPEGYSDTDEENSIYNISAYVLKLVDKVYLGK